MSLPKPYYEHDGVTIYHGDCREMMPVLPNVDCVITNPPYNVQLGSQQHGVKRVKQYISHLDYRTDKEYQDFLTPTFYRIFGTPAAFVTPGNSNQWIWPPPRWTMAWTKANGITRTPLTRGQKMQHSCWEPILVYGKVDLPPHSDVLNVPISVQQEVEGHPCPKPLKLFQLLVSMIDGGKTILDPFMGSGTTLRAAKDLRRKAIGIEIEEKYCEIAAKRLEQEVFDF